MNCSNRFQSLPFVHRCFELSVTVYKMTGKFRFMDGLCKLMSLESEEVEPEVAWLRTGIEQVVAAVALVILSMPIMLTALITKVMLGSPVLFNQTRVGKNMSNFVICKFRTMLDTRDGNGKLLPDRLRETPFSRIIRKIRLDEFPQLFAIAAGKMAFIGPRPLLPETIQSMGYLGKVRCKVRPGLSGWAQINGNTQLSDMQKLSLDIWYIDNRGPLVDAVIVWKTLLMIMGGERLNQRHIDEAEAYVKLRYASAASVVESVAR
jgi:lipopolysaccharide/colanic/teichoic acid biosynthesis glycosyltransferase